MHPTLRVARRAFAVSALIGVAALATACRTSPGTAAGNNAAPVASDSTTPDSTAPATPAATTPAAPATTPAAPAGPSSCPTRSLHVRLGASQGTAGSVYTTIVFRNVSNATCTLYGYPGVSLTTGSPVTVIGKSAKENPATPRRLVTLQPQTSANALLRIVDAQNYAASDCSPKNSTYLQVYPPNQTAPVRIKFKTVGCAKPINLLTVDVVKPGSGSS
jgi:Domain of unknown function (DUF4232)